MPLEWLNRCKYCLYHHGHGHDTEEYIQLWDEIEELIDVADWTSSFKTVKRGEMPQRLRYAYLGHL